MAAAKLLLKANTIFQIANQIRTSRLMKSFHFAEVDYILPSQQVYIRRHNAPTTKTTTCL